MYAYPWGKPNSVLEHETGPEDWQHDALAAIGHEVIRNGFDGSTTVDPIKMAYASGHGIGKSTFTSWLIHWIMSTRPYCKLVITANTAEQIGSKTWAELAKWTSLLINQHWFVYHNSHANRIFYHKDHKDEWFAKAIPWREEKSEAFAGQHATTSTSGYIFDEAGYIPKKILEVAEGGLTDGEPMMFLFGNPTRNSGPFFEAFNRNKHRWITRQIDSRSVKRTNKELIDRWVEDYGEDSDFVRVRVRGVFPRSGSLQLISSEMVRAAMKRKYGIDVYGHREKIMAVDVARFGDDQSVICMRQGLAVFPLKKYRGLDLMQLADCIVAQIREWKPHMVFVDVVGIGAGVVDRLHQLGFRKTVMGINVGERPVNKKYRNKRAEIWDSMKVWLETGWIPEDVELEADLTGLEYGYTPKDQILLERKEDMKKRGLASPDCADALALTFSLPVKVPSPYEELIETDTRHARREYNIFVDKVNNGRRYEAKHKYQVI
jgi:hypothetical protein